MARKAEIIREIDISDGTYVDPDEPQKTSADEALDDFMSKSRAVGATAKITVNKLSNGVNSAETFCAYYPVDKYDYFELLEVIRDTWGAGDYRLYCTIKGKKGVLQNEFISIAPAIRPNNLPSVIQKADNTDLLSVMLSAIQESNNKVIEAMQSGGSNRQQFLQELLLYKQIFDGGAQPKQSILSGVKEMAETMAILRELGGGESKESGMMDLAIEAVKGLTPVAAALMTQRAAHPPASHRQRPQRPKPTPAPSDKQGQTIDSQPIETNPRTEPTQEPTQEPIMQHYKSQLEQLCTLLNFSQPDPAEFATQLDDGLETDAQVEALGVLLESENPLAELQKVCPNVAKHSEWFGDLIEHLRAMAGMPSKYADEYAEDGTEIDSENNLSDTPSHDANNTD